MDYFEKQDIDRFFDLWEERIGKGIDVNPLRKSLELLGKDFKWLNALKFQNSEFRKRFEEFETKLETELLNELNEFMINEYYKLRKQGRTDKDIQEEFGKNFSIQKLKDYKPEVKTKGDEYYEKFKVKHDPNSKDPLERLLYYEEYKKRLLDQKKRDQERSIQSRLKRKEEIDDLKMRFSNSGDIDEYELERDWRRERIIQSYEKKEQKLKDQIKKNKELNKLRVEKEKKLQEEKLLKQKTLDKQRRDRDKEKEKLKDLKNVEVEKLRVKRIREREKLQKERQIKRKKREESRRSKEFQTKVKIEEIKNTLFGVKVPKNILDKVKFSDRYGKKLFDVSGNVMWKYCGNCGEHKKWDHYHSNGKDKNGKKKLSTYCISCTRIKQGLDPGTGRRGEFYKGEQRFRKNDRGNIIERKCTSCGDFKKVKEFNYLYRTSRVCKDCYVEQPNNVLTRRGEMKRIKGKEVQIRVYDENTFLVLKKRCNTCEELKDLDQFTRNNNNNLDGRVGRCRSCTKKLKDEKKGLVKKKKS